MVRLVSRGCFTHNYAKGLVSAPEDREPAVHKLIEGAGGKLLHFYFTTGDTDFMVVSEANDSESIIAALLAAVASGAAYGHEEWVTAGRIRAVASLGIMPRGWLRHRRTESRLCAS